LIEFEFPLNERVRTWLRIEDLFDKALFFVRASDSRSHHAALLAIFELVDVMGRSELRSELLQELERQKSALDALRGNPSVHAESLETILDQIGVVLADLHILSGKPGQYMRENDWLAGIKSRTGIPGGTCSFDLPSYHAWLNQSSEERESDLMNWITPLLHYRNAVAIVLKLLRESGSVSQHAASQGVYQLMLGGRVVHLVRIGIEDRLHLAPEVSANKYAVNIRFTVLDKLQKPRTCEEDVAFRLTFCSLAGCCL
jgi:cell division protein ZapD